jgi:hypothetical protein
MKKKLTAIGALIALSSMISIVYAVETIRLGENKTVTEMKGFDSWAINGEADIDFNTASVNLHMLPGQSAEGKAYFGPDIELSWDGPYTWEEIKNVPLRVATSFNYQILSGGYGFGAVNIHIANDGSKIFNDTITSGGSSGSFTKSGIINLEKLGPSFGIHCRGFNDSENSTFLYGDITSYFTKFEFFQFTSLDINQDDPDLAHFYIPITVKTPYETIFGSISTANALYSSALPLSNSSERIFFVNFGETDGAELITNNLFIHAYENPGDYEITFSYPGDFVFDGDVDGSDIAEYISNFEKIEILLFAQNFGKLCKEVGVVANFDSN